jgi:mandelate racemase
VPYGSLIESPPIRDLTIRPVDLPLEHPVETASGVLRTAALVLVDVRDEDGVAGHSYLRTYTPVALRALAALLDDLAPLLHGLPADPAAVRARLHAEFRLLGAHGLAGAAIAGIDMALWDIAARRAGRPLAALLGSDRRRVPAYASLHAMAPGPAAAEAEQALADGFGAIKVKVGRGDLAADLEVIRALRAVAGDGVPLMVDYNQSLSVEEAIARAAALDAEGVAWIEEPTRADDFAGHARIVAAARVPIQLGENWQGPGDVERSIAAGASDLGMPDAMKVGGVSGWREAAALAADAGLPLSSHTFPEYSVHLLAATPTAQWLEHLDHVGPILLEPVTVVGGEAHVPDRPGAGLEWDEAALRRVLGG